MDAILECENGHTLRAKLRWRTPEETHRVNTPDLTILTAAPKGSVTTDVAVTNAGSAPVGLGSARLLDADMSTAAPLSVVGSTCVRLASRPPGQTPTGTHQRPDMPRTAMSAEGRTAFAAVEDCEKVRADADADPAMVLIISLYGVPGC